MTTHCRPHCSVADHEQLAAYTSDCRDLEGRLTKYMQAASVLAGDAEKLAGISDKISQTSALGRSTDQAHVKTSISELREKVDKAKADVAATLAELKAIQTHIDERHKGESTVCVCACVSHCG